MEYNKTILLIQYVDNSFDYLIETLAILILNNDQIGNEEVQHSSDAIKSSMVRKVSYRSVSYSCFVLATNIYQVKSRVE